MVGRHRHLRRADEVEVLALDPVDVVGGLAEEAGALHRPRPDQRRRDHLGEAGVAGLLHRQVDQRQLELGADAGEEVEARARHLGAALDVDGAEHPAELDVVARLEPLGGEVARRADRLEDGVVVLAAGRRVVVGQVGDRQDRGLPGLLGLASGPPRPPSPRRRAPWCAPAAPASRRPAPAGSACRASSARPAWPRSPRSRCGAAVSAASASSTTASDSPRLAWAARTRSGWSRRMRGSITGPRLVVTAAAAHPRLHRTSSVAVRRCLHPARTPSYFCGAGPTATRAVRLGAAVVPAVRAGDARGRPGLGSRSRSSTTAVAPAAEYAVDVGLAGPAAAGHRGDVPDRRHDDHDARRRGADARPRPPPRRALHGRRHGDDHRGLHRRQGAGRPGPARVAARSGAAVLASRTRRGTPPRSPRSAAS